MALYKNKFEWMSQMSLSNKPYAIGILQPSGYSPWRVTISVKRFGELLKCHRSPGKEQGDPSYLRCRTGMIVFSQQCR